jgi:aryl-alcohol dehydrogenase-like predicted oxidoreductase
MIHLDTLILGMSSESHLGDNLRAARQGPLTAKVLTAIDKIWEVAAVPYQPYFFSRPPTSNMPAK